MTLHPFLDSSDVLLGILQIIADIARLAAGHKAIFGRFARFRVDGPATVLDASREVVGSAVGFGILQV